LERWSPEARKWLSRLRFTSEKTSPGECRGILSSIALDPIGFCEPSRMTNQGLVPVVIRLVRAFHRHADVVGLGLGEGRQMNAEFFEVEACDFFVEDLRERVHDAAFILDASDSLSIFLRNLSWPVQRRDFSFLTTFRVVPATWVADAHKGNAVLH